MDTNDLQSLIQQSTILDENSKNYLLNSLGNLNPLEKLKIRSALTAGNIPEIIVKLQTQKEQFKNIEAKNQPKPISPAKNDILSKLMNKIAKPPEKPKPVANSLLTQPVLLGGPIPKPINNNPNLPALNNLNEINDLEQLKLLHARHISFDINQNSSIEIQNFINHTFDLFNELETIEQRRSYYLGFLSSPLFSAYINTGLTALRHPELQPYSVILNTLYQIDEKYLNNKQFKFAGMISNHLRSLSAL
jgi:hypothetical protein